MKYKDIIGYSKSKKTVKTELKPKINDVLESIKEEFGYKGDLKEVEGFESKDGKAAQRQYKRLYDRNIKNGEKYFASSVDSLADFMEKQGLGNQAQMLRGEYMRVVQKWQDKWLKQFVKSLK